MQTLNAIANENYNATPSNDPWHCATDTSMAHLTSSLDMPGVQEPPPSSSERSLTISNEQSPALGVEDFFSSLDTASSSKNPRSETDSSTAKRSVRSPSSIGRSSDDTGHRVQKRQRNTEAARRYRQRKVDKVDELEEALQLMTKERDDLRLRLARSEAEADVLRDLVGKRN